LWCHNFNFYEKIPNDNNGIKFAFEDILNNIKRELRLERNLGTFWAYAMDDEGNWLKNEDGSWKMKNLSEFTWKQEHIPKLQEKLKIKIVKEGEFLGMPSQTDQNVVLFNLYIDTPDVKQKIQKELEITRASHKTEYKRWMTPTNSNDIWLNIHGTNLSGSVMDELAIMTELEKVAGKTNGYGIGTQYPKWIDLLDDTNLNEIDKTNFKKMAISRWNQYDQTYNK
jgi:hypothetical protein